MTGNYTNLLRTSRETIDQVKIKLMHLRLYDAQRMSQSGQETLNEIIHAIVHLETTIDNIK